MHHWRLIMLPLLVALVVLICRLNDCVQAQPFERIWLKIKLDERLDQLTSCVGRSSAKGETLEETLQQYQHFNLPRKLGKGAHGQKKILFGAQQDQLHAYRLQEIDMHKPIGDLGLVQGDELYLTDRDLLAK